MSGGVVCYLERSHGGSVLTRVRLMAIGLSRSWTAPEAQGELAESVPSGAPGGGPALASVRSAARWVTETLQGAGIKRLACVCVDADGAICTWLSAPSADPSVIRATIAQSEHESDGHSGLGAGRLIALAAPGATMASGAGSDTSVQALASPPSAAAGNGTTQSRRRLLSRGSTAPDAGSLRRNRYAVLAVPDSPVRVFLDELDARGIEVQAVTSLWHAMGRAWTSPDEGGADSNGSAVVSSSSPTSAIVLVQPAEGPAGTFGRLVWAWARSGELLAGGTMRLKTITHQAESAPPAPPTPLGAPADELATIDARRVARDEPAEEDEVQIEFSAADAGRLAVDWLSWSAQLGHCPRRIVLIASPGATDEQGSGPTSLGRLLGRAWPNSTIDAAVYDDPTQATLARLAGVRQGPDEREELSLPPQPLAELPRAALVGLSTRSGKADRRMYRWAAIGMATGAVLIGVVGWRLRTSADAFVTSEATTRKSITDLLTNVQTITPGVAGFKPKDQVDTLEKKRNELKEAAKKVRAPRPVLEETIRALAALNGHTGIDITDFSIGFVSGSIQIEIPESSTAADVGPEILQKIQSIKGDLTWSGTPSSFSSPGKRRYVLTGIWPVDDPSGGSR